MMIDPISVKPLIQYNLLISKRFLKCGSRKYGERESMVLTLTLHSSGMEK